MLQTDELTILICKISTQQLFLKKSCCEFVDQYVNIVSENHYWVSFVTWKIGNQTSTGDDNISKDGTLNFAV